MTDATTPASTATSPAPVPVVVPAEPEGPSHAQRVADLIAAYEHGMNSNAPRTMAEFAELKVLLLGV